MQISRDFLKKFESKLKAETDKEKPILKKIIQKYFIEGGMIAHDPWLVNIGHTMLGEHVNALNALYLQQIMQAEKKNLV